MGSWISRTRSTEASIGKKPMAAANVQVPAELAPGRRRLGVQVIQAFALPNSNSVLVVSAGSVVNFQGDAIVNAANEGCITGGGVDGAITSAGGPALAQARQELPIVEGRSVRCPTGTAVITIGGDLQVPYCIHAVGPNYYSEQAHGRTIADCDALVASAYQHSLARGQEKGLKSIGFSLISSGIFRGPQSLRKVLEAGVVGICRGVYPELEEVHMIAFTGAEQRELQDVCAELLTSGKGGSAPSSPLSTSGKSGGQATPASKEAAPLVQMQTEPVAPVKMTVEEEIFTNEPPPSTTVRSSEEGVSS